jgi:hypothetical protein
VGEEMSQVYECDRCRAHVRHEDIGSITTLDGARWELCRECRDGLDLYLYGAKLKKLKDDG